MRASSTISCRVFALSACLLAACAAAARGEDAPDRRVRDKPLLPITEKWTNPLPAGVTVPPATDGPHIFLALRSGKIEALDATDGHELWTKSKEVAGPFALDSERVFVTGGEAIEALRISDGASVWVVPRIKTVAPLVVDGGSLFALTDAEVIVIRTTDGSVIWRRPAGGARLAPAVDGDHVYIGAQDGRVAAMMLASGEPVWEKYLEGGVTALAASRGLVYAGAGNKKFYCLDGKDHEVRWEMRIGALIEGRIAIDEDHVYFGAFDNVVWGLDRVSGNQRWHAPLHERPVAGVIELGNVVFVPSQSSTLQMIYAPDGRPSGTISLPAQMQIDLPPAVHLVPGGLEIVVVTTDLSNAWQLTLIGPDPGPPLEALAALPGLDFLTDPILETPSRGLWSLLAGEPLLFPLSEIGFPVVLTDPPLESFTTLPGLQLRPLSPTLPIRRAGSGQGG
jgi:putative pyrroloquinoline-quinone binding quinoprotein/putative pyrroloquinoline-quinone-binding quinoprotein